MTAFTDAQFSQKQEYEADEYGFEFSVKHGFSPYAMGNSLNKLVELSKGAKASTVQKMFSSHPDSEKRAARMKEKADAHAAAHNSKSYTEIRRPARDRATQGGGSYSAANAANNLSVAQLRQKPGKSPAFAVHSFGRNRRPGIFEKHIRPLQ